MGVEVSLILILLNQRLNEKRCNMKIKKLKVQKFNWLHLMLCFFILKEFYDIVVFFADESNGSPLPVDSTEIDLPALSNQQNSDNVPAPTKDGIAACLLVLDDTIFLKEWLAYHYTVLPLSSLIIALDPKNAPSSVRRIQEIANRYNKLFNDTKITFWYNDTFIHDEEIRDSITNFEKNNPRKVYRFKRISKQLSPKIQVFPQRERQCQFVSECMKEHKRQGESWVLLTDTDEFLVFNYVSQKNGGENLTFYDKNFYQRRDLVDKARKTILPIRQKLPPLHNSTVAEFLRKHPSSNPCYRVVGLSFGSRESSIETLRRVLSPETLRSVPRPEKLITEAHRSHQKVRIGTFNKVMVDVSRVAEEHLTRKNCFTIHNANKLVCSNTLGGKVNTPFGQDYISSFFRINHYVGSFEAFLERSGDYRGERDEAMFWAKQSKYTPESTADDDAIRPWLNHFVTKVGPQVSSALLEQNLPN